MVNGMHRMWFVVAMCPAKRNMTQAFKKIEYLISINT